LAKRLFGVDVLELTKEEIAEKNVSMWHEDVRIFKVLTGDKVTAYFYLDAFARAGTKRGGAWMNEVCGKTSNPKLRVNN